MIPHVDSTVCKKVDSSNKVFVDFVDDDNDGDENDDNDGKGVKDGCEDIDTSCAGTLTGAT